MTTRILPPAEWDKLAVTNAAELWPQLQPDSHVVLVIEDGDRIVGSLLLLKVVHAECLWIHPAYRQQIAVGRRLVKALWSETRALGLRTVWASAIGGRMRWIVRKLGGVPLPGEHYILTVKGV